MYNRDQLMELRKVRQRAALPFDVIALLRQLQLVRYRRGCRGGRSTRAEGSRPRQ